MVECASTSAATGNKARSLQASAATFNKRRSLPAGWPTLSNLIFERVGPRCFFNRNPYRYNSGGFFPAPQGAQIMKKAPRTKSQRAGTTRAANANKSKKPVKFLHKPNCTTCRKARAFMESRGVPLDFRDLGKERLSVEELEALIGDRDHADFLNTRNELYRAKNMKQHPPSRNEAIRMMAAEPNLIRRPIVVAGGRIVIGFDEKGMAEF